jgi:hypothetical protein
MDKQFDETITKAKNMLTTKLESIAAASLSEDYCTLISTLCEFGCQDFSNYHQREDSLSRAANELRLSKGRVDQASQLLAKLNLLNKVK